MFITEKQAGFINKLASERGMTKVDVIEQWDGDFGRSLNQRSCREASEIIDWLKAMPVAALA
jgi:hypothetical protein